MFPAVSNNRYKFFAALSFCYFSFISSIFSQTKYWVSFTDKVASPYSISSPSVFLSEKSIQRRINHNIAIDLTDIPVNQTYVNAVNGTGALVFQTSKWFNAAIVIINDPAQLTAINNLPFVKNIKAVGLKVKSDFNETLDNTKDLSKIYKTVSASSYDYGQSFTQSNMIGIDCMHNLGYRGQNILIAVIDGGFYQVDVNPIFDSLRNEGRLLGTRDIVAGNNSVFEDDSHGALVLSLLAGNSPGNLIGTAPKAKYFLIRSENVLSEKKIEESNLVVALELADSLGADVTSTSLGYNTFDNPADNYLISDLNGKTSIASIASTIAARKGIFVVNAAGNEGASSWKYVCTPADADSILTVGSVNSAGIKSSFSSIGPTADGRIKPDVCAMGEGSYVGRPGNNFSSGNGTSFSCPIMAGAAACLIQANGNKNNMQILNAIKLSSSKAYVPENFLGWGIPSICSANLILKLPLGLNDNRISNNGLNLFPNPAKDELNFQINDEILNIKLTDIYGKQIDFSLSQKINQEYKINLNSNMAMGIYFINLKTSSRIINAKFIKE